MSQGGTATMDATKSSSSAPTQFGAARSTGKLVGLLAEFDTSDALLIAARQVREAGYRNFDAHSPFPVHGIEKAAGIRRTRLPLLVFCLGLLGTCTALFLQLWTNAGGGEGANLVPSFLRGQAYVVSGKPLLSIPMFIPVTFELTVLFASLTAVFGMLLINNLPWFHNAVFSVPRFARVTDDKFFIVIGAADPHFREAEAWSLLASAGGKVERIEEQETPGAPPWLRRAGVVLLMAALIPPLFVARARNVKSSTPRIHIVQDMDNQEKFKGQSASLLFKDGRSARLPVGATPDNLLGLTVARGELRDDNHFFRGWVSNDFARTFPEFDRTAGGKTPLAINAEFIARGHDRFDIYCTPCHGMSGNGNGAVSLRAIEMQEPTWVAAGDFHTPEIIGRPVGHLFNTITNGIRSMPPYGDQIPERDRWAIVAYIRALQRMDNAKLSDVPADTRKILESR